MNRKKIGIYRTAFPLYSETFIVEQMCACTYYEPVVICRDLYFLSDKFKYITIEQRNRRLKKFAFSLFGISNVFDNKNVLNELKLLHAHFAPDAVLALSLTKSCNIPLVVTCHGSDIMVSDWYLLKSMRLTNWRYMALRYQLMHKTSLFIAVSDFLRNAMIERGFPSEKVVRHYVGIDTNRFVPVSDQSTLYGGATFILSIARHTDVKGVDVLLKAFSRVVQMNSDVRLVQIGAGDLTEELKTLAAELNVDKSVDFLGPQNPSEVLKHLQACRILVLSSRQAKSGAEESFGLVLAEAAACGVPTIGTRVGGIPEAIIDGETGYIVEPEDPDELAERMLQLLADRKSAKAMGMRGRAMVCERFDIRIQTEKLENLYSEVIKEHSNSMQKT